jgi:membrane-associated phospholipid phosphatase
LQYILSLHKERMNFRLSKTFDYIGYFAPLFLFVVTIFLILHKRMTTLVFIAGYIGNLILNAALKMCFQQPRPSQTQHSFGWDFSDVYKNADKLGPHEYGMPSGHSQTVWFITTFITMALKDNMISLVYAGISICTMIQRIQYKNHTMNQVLAGMVVGSLFAYWLYSEILII